MRSLKLDASRLVSGWLAASVALAGLLLASCVRFTPTQFAQPLPMDNMTPCVARVVEVRTDRWNYRTTNNSGVVERDESRRQYVLKLEFIAPAKFAGKVREIGSDTEEHAIVDGKPLHSGDVIRFMAPRALFDEHRAPDRFSSLQDVRRVGAAQSSKS